MNIMNLIVLFLLAPSLIVGLAVSRKCNILDATSLFRRNDTDSIIEARNGISAALDDDALGDFA